MTKIETLVARAKVEYGIDEANSEAVYPYSPARATNAIAKRYSYPKSRLIGIVAAVYYAENGARSPLPASATKGRKSLANAIAKRRNAKGRLGRWEVIAASASATLGRPIAVAAIRALAEEGGIVAETDYVGRGTRVAAPATREDEAAEIGLG